MSCRSHSTSTDSARLTYDEVHPEGGVLPVGRRRCGMRRCRSRHELSASSWDDGRGVTARETQSKGCGQCQRSEADLERMSGHVMEAEVMQEVQFFNGLLGRLRCGSGMGCKTRAGAGSTAIRAVSRRGSGAALRLSDPASGPDGVGAVTVDGQIGGLGCAGRTVDRNAALSGNQQGDEVSAHGSCSEPR